MAQSRQDAAPTGYALLSWERHVYTDVLMSWSAGMRGNDAAAISRHKNLLRRLGQLPNNPQRTIQIRSAKKIQMIQHVIELV